MRHFFITVIGTVIGIFAFFIALFLLTVLFGGIGAISASMKPKDSYILTMDLRQPVIDHDAGTSLFGATPPSVVTTARALRRAKTDDSVKGLFIRAESFGMAPASAEELRLALLDFKSSGKFVIAHAQGFEGTSIIPFQAVSAADEIWMQDTTGFAISGLRSESEFYGGVFEKLDAQPQFEQFYEYKNAANTYTQKGYTAAHKEAATSYLTSIHENAVAQIAEDRGLEPDALKALFMASPHSAEDAKDAKLVDKLGHIETAREYAKKKAGDGDQLKFKTVMSYGVRTKVTGDAIAFVGGQGPVINGSSSAGSPFNPGLSMGGDTITKAIDDAIEDKAVKAIVFRVSTPGGSPAASDQILAAADRAKEAGKPVIVSMGQYAASGGYYVSAHADHIVALPQTITGSIGVLGGKVALEDTFAKIGYNIEGITIGGDYAGAYSADEPFNQGQRAAYRGQLQDIYDDFTTRVANGRKIPLERVKEIAKGRVWTGAQAKEIGLVDELGGFFTAVEAAKRLAEIDEDAESRIKVFPRAKSTQEQINELLSGSVQMQQDIAALRQITELPEVQAALEARQATRIGQELTADIPEIK